MKFKVNNKLLENMNPTTNNNLYLETICFPTDMNIGYAKEVQGSPVISNVVNFSFKKLILGLSFKYSINRQQISINFKYK